MNGIDITNLNFKSLLDTNGFLKVDLRSTTITGVENDHDRLDNLDYDVSGHTGFASSAMLSTASGILNDKIDTTSGTLQDAIDDIVVGAVSWEAIQNKPSTFTPSVHGDEAHSLDYALYSELTTASGVLQDAIDNIDLSAYATTIYVDTVSGSLQDQIDNLTPDHASLTNLDYASSGHTGFQPAGDYATVSGLTAISGSLQDAIDNIVMPTDFYSRAEVDTISGSIVAQIPTDYISDSEMTTISGNIVSQIITDHGGLTGLLDNDHPQYDFSTASGILNSKIDTTSGTLQDAIDNIVIPTDFYTQSEVDTISGAIVSQIPSLTGYATEGYVDTVSGALNTSKVNTSDFTELAQDVIGTSISGVNITVSYNDGTGITTLSGGSSSSNINYGGSTTTFVNCDDSGVQVGDGGTYIFQAYNIDGIPGETYLDISDKLCFGGENSDYADAIFNDPTFSAASNSALTTAYAVKTYVDTVVSGGLPVHGNEKHSSVFSTEGYVDTVSGALNVKIGQKEDAIGAKGTAFNKNYGTTADTVASGLHTHSGIYEPAFSKNTAFNKNFGTASGDVCQGNDARLSDARTPTSHGNAQHTSTFITATDITYENLNANSDVGTGATQVAQGDHTHATLHTRSHTMTSTSDHTAGNWKLFYSNGSGEIVELGLGADNTVLKSTGTGSAPGFATVSGIGIGNVVEDTSPELGGDLDMNNKYIAFTAAPSNDETGSGFTAIMTVDTNSYGVASALCMAADGNFDEANCSGVATMPCTALALETGTGSKKVMLQGFIRDDTWSWTPGGLIYVSSTAGTLTQTLPSTTGHQVQIVGFATHADRMYFNPSYTIGEVK
jgi:hypothetical protein